MANWYDKYLSIYGKSPDEISESIFKEIKEKILMMTKEELVAQRNEERRKRSWLGI